MHGNEFSLGIVFLAGIVSFLSPCVFPIVPAYLSLISGLSFAELQQDDSVRHARWRLFGSALGFIFGFSIVIIGLLGGLVSLMGQLGDVWRFWFRAVGAIIVFLFALHMIGALRINAFYQERRFHLEQKQLGYFGSVLIGAAFAFGWSPCIGPILGGVLGLAAGTAKTGLLIAYTSGLAIPFLLAAVFVNAFLGAMHTVTRHMRTVEILSGVLLLVMGMLLLTGQLSVLSQQGGMLLEFSSRLEDLLR